MDKKDKTMAMLRSGLFGQISGKVGDFVYYTAKNGRQYVRKAPKRSSKEPTEAQLAQRARFAFVTSFLRSFKPIFQILPEPASTKHSCYTLSLKQIFANAVIGEYPDFQIDYSKVTFARSSLSYFNFSAESKDNRIAFQWMHFDYQWHYLRVIMIAFCPASGQVVYSTADLENTNNSCELQLPEDLFGEHVETWLIFLGWDGKLAGGSAYCGSVS